MPSRRADRTRVGNGREVHLDLHSRQSRRSSPARAHASAVDTGARIRCRRALTAKLALRAQPVVTPNLIRDPPSLQWTVGLSTPLFASRMNQAAHQASVISSTLSMIRLTVAGPTISWRNTTGA